MKNKVTEFPKTRSNRAKVRPEAAMVFFTTGERRFAVQWVITEVPVKKAEVIPFEKRPGDEVSHAKDLKSQNAT
jgi:hypothetical protein